LNQLVVPFGKNSSIRLPDGTIASLNAGSRLIYPSKFEGKNREVYLIGEGFFEVSHNADMPFIVKTSDLQVEVLGTKFNLSAYPSDSFIETVLVEGKVKLIENAFQIVKGNFVLEPNQLASYNRENAETKIAHVDVRNYVAWHHGYLNFESSDLSRIVKKLERYYNIQIRLGDPMLGSRTISGKLKLKEEIDGVLTALASTASAELVKINESIYVVK
jgi:ferric-dicitrate binding protein FerR (iron transport regulator)